MRRLKFLGAVVLIGLYFFSAMNSVVLAAPDQNRKTPEEILKQAGRLISNEQLDRALGILKKLDPSSRKISSRINNLVGKIYLRLGKPAKALAVFEKVSFSSLDDTESYLGMAQASLALGKLKQARTHASTAIKSDPDLIEAELIIARTEDLGGRVEEARHRIKTLFDRQPGNEKIVVAYGAFLADRVNLKDAIAVLSRYVSAQPLAAEANDLLGQLYWRQGQKSKAARHRLVAVKAFKDRGNKYRADAIMTWIIVNTMGEFGDQSKPREKPKSTEVSPHKTPKSVLSRPEPLPIPVGATYGQGSGFIVGGGKYVVTNRHVIEGGKSVFVRNGLGEIRHASVVGVGKKDDLAVLKLKKPFPMSYSIPFSHMIDPRPGRAALIMGFPLAEMLGESRPSLTEGIVSKVTGLRENPTIFQLTSNMNKGNSGGPIFDRRGNLIGVAVAKLNKTTILEKEGFLPEDVNLAIKINRVLKMLKQGPNGDIPDKTPKLDLEDIYQQMLPSVVMIIAIIKKS